MTSEEIFYERLGRPADSLSLERRKQDVLYDKKWKLFLRRARLFRYIPFIKFVLGAGSMALGNVNENSDFDVLVSAKYGRIFTTRAFCILLFGAAGYRRTKISHSGNAKDKICLNHFITEKKYRLAPPHNIYWQELYANLVPIYGDVEKINAFIEANDWVNKKTSTYDPRYQFQEPLMIVKILEKFLNGALGNVLEKALKNIQVVRIERSLKIEKPGFAPRLKYSDEELEFHPSQQRIYELTKGLG